jgi:hypothetical protein
VLAAGHVKGQFCLMMQAAMAACSGCPHRAAQGDAGRSQVQRIMNANFREYHVPVNAGVHISR